MTDEKRLKQAVFYLDESIYSRVLASPMQVAGANVRRVGPDIQKGSTDEEWLEIVGGNNWIALMRDQKIRRRRLETEALKTHGVAAFAFTGGQETAQQTAQTICPLLVKFANMNVSEPKPFLYTFGVSGTLSKVKLLPRSLASHGAPEPSPGHPLRISEGCRVSSCLCRVLV